MELITQDVVFELLKSGTKIAGFKIGGCGNPNTEAFCISFLEAHARGKADFRFDGKKLRFEHAGLSKAESLHNHHPGGAIVWDLTPEEAKAIADLLGHQGEYKGTTYRMFLMTGSVKGFEVKLWGVS